MENYCSQRATKGASCAVIVPWRSYPYQYRFLEAEHAGRTTVPPPRLIYTNFYFQNWPNFYEAVVDIGARKVIWQKNLGSNVHAPGTLEEIESMHDIAMNSELVQKEIARLQLLPGSEVVCEPWPYGKDGVNDDDRLLQVNTLNHFHKH